MSFTSSLPRTTALGLGALSAVAVAEHLLLPIGLLHSVLGALLVAPLWLLATVVARRRELSPSAAVGVGCGLGAATIAATGLADLVIAPVVFLLGACLQVVITDRCTARSMMDGRAQTWPSSRVDILIAQAAVSANDLRLVR